MNWKKIIFGVALSSIMCFSILYAHENETVHPYTLTYRAKNLITDNTLPSYLPGYNELDKFFNAQGQPIEKGTQGTIDEDGEGWSDFLSNTRPLNHFYNPQTGEGLPIPLTQTSLAYGPTLWQDAIEKYGNEKYKDSYYSAMILGAVV